MDFHGFDKAGLKVLVLSRKNDEKIHVGDNITITILAITGNRVKLGIDAPKEITILRSELRPDKQIEGEI